MINKLNSEWFELYEKYKLSGDSELYNEMLKIDNKIKNINTDNVVEVKDKVYQEIESDQFGECST